MTLIKLSKVAKIESGAGFPLALQGKEGKQFPFLKVSDMNIAGNEKVIRTWNNSISDEVRTSLKAKVFPKNAIIFPKVGAAIATNKKRRIEIPSCIDNNVMGVIPNEDLILPEYLYYLFFYKNISDFASSANPPSIRKSDVEDWLINVPPKDEQEKILEILSLAENIVTQRRLVIQKSETLTHAIFVEMFGNVVTNEKNWNVEKFSDIGVLDRGKSRHRPRDAAHLYGGNYPFIQTGDVANCGGLITTFSNTYSEDGLAQSRLWDIDTLCITIAANIAKTGILKIKACFPDSVVGFTVDKTKATNRYVQTWLSFLQPILEANAPQAAQKNINLQILRSLPIPVPPLELQHIFDKKVTEIELMKARQIDALTRSRDLFDSLMSEYFQANTNKGCSILNSENKLSV
jgi:type I restriction enzyme, S subunit